MNGETSSTLSKGNEVAGVKKRESTGTNIKAEGMKSVSQKNLASPTGPSPAKKIKIEGGQSQNSVLKRPPGTPPVQHKPSGSPIQKPSGSSTQKPSGSSTQKPSGSSTQKPSGSSTQNPSGNSIQKPSGNSIQKPSGNSIQKPSGNSIQKPSGSSTQKPSGSSTQKPSGSSIPKPSGGSIPKPSGGSIPKPSGSSTQKPSGGSSQKPSGGSSQKPSGSSSQKPSGGSSQKPSSSSSERSSTGSSTHKPSGSSTHKSSSSSSERSSTGSSQNPHKSSHSIPPGGAPSVKIKKDPDGKQSSSSSVPNKVSTPESSSRPPSQSSNKPSIKSPNGTIQKPAIKSPIQSPQKPIATKPSSSGSSGSSTKPSNSSIKPSKSSSDGQSKHSKPSHSSSNDKPRENSSNGASKAPSNSVPPVKVKKESIDGRTSSSGSSKPSSSSKPPSSSSKDSSRPTGGATVPVVKKEPVSPTKPVSQPEAKKELNSPSARTPSVKQEGSSKKVKTDVKTEVKIEEKAEVKTEEKTEPVSAEKIKIKKEAKESSDDEPLSVRIEKKHKHKSKDKIKEERKSHGKRKKEEEESDNEFAPQAKSKKKDKERHRDKGKSKHGDKEKSKHKEKVKVKQEEVKGKGKGKKKVKAEEPEVWKWWEEEPHPEGIKWITLDHNGPYFPDLYERLPKTVKFYYEDEQMVLSDNAEEVAGFYARMLEHDYTKKEMFNNNFFEDWRKEMTDEERKTIKSLKKCNFKEMCSYFNMKSEERKNKTKEQKLQLKKENEVIAEKHGSCMMDNHSQKVGNFKIEPPGLFRGRGDHPKQGKLKKRVQPEDVIINIGKEGEVPKAPEGHKWKSVQHDNKVTWLACWVENIAGSYKYVMLNSATKLKGEKDWQKYEIARKLKKCVHKIRTQYGEDLKSKEMRIRQRAVALYFIDKLALRAGHEKEEGETADTVGCCSLRVEHIKLHKEFDGNDCVVEFDFLGKDSIRYQNNVPVDKRVFRNLQYFVEDKEPDDDLFDRLTTSTLNQHLKELMDGLTAKVFRTYNASTTLQDQLKELTDPSDNLTGKFLSYNRANRAVAILCNHQRAAPKTFDKQMENLMNKIKDKKKLIKECKREVKELKGNSSSKSSMQLDKKRTQTKRLQEQLFKLEVSMTDKDENKLIALGTSKLNYLDPRISIAWCKKNDVPVEKVYNKTQRQKFQWAMDMTEEDFVF